MLQDMFTHVSVVVC